MRNRILKISIILLTLLGFQIASAENRHPRVVELEKTLSSETLEVLKGRFPNKPFLASVSIDPLMRDKKAGGVQDRLPYYEVSDEELADEWDDPDASNSFLLNRVRRIHVKLSVPSSLTDDEIAELKTTVVKNLSLLEARDTVEIQKRAWTNLDQNNSMWSYLGIGLALWFLSMLGMGLISWLNSRKLSSAIASGLNEGQKGASPMPMPGAPLDIPERTQNHSNPVAGDIRFNDPIKTRDSIQTAIRVIEGHGAFPMLEDLIILEKFSLENTASFGALLAEFPWEVRKKLFGYSKGDQWLQALAEPGEVSNSCLEVLQKCARVQRAIERTDWQELLILVWRLNDKAAEFFKNTDQEKAFNILGYLPRSISVSIARNIYPGAWGVLLNPHHTPKMLNEAETAVLIAHAKRILPLKEINLIDKYRSEKDLLSFVKTADPQVEKEIYQVAKDDLNKMRAPFFPVFEASDEVITKLHSCIRPEDWALSFYNIPKTDRKRIEAQMSERQKIRCYELLRQYDQNPPAPARIGDARERIAKALQFCQLEVMESKTTSHLEDVKAA